MSRVRRVRSYSVSKAEIEGFVSENDCVSDFLGRYGEAARAEYAEELCRFFKWLAVVKGVELSPKEVLNEQLRLRSSLNVEDRRRFLKLALAFSRDNPDLAGASDGRKYFIFTVVRQFFSYHEVPLTTSKGIYGTVKKRKYKPKQMDRDLAKKVLGVMNQRDRTILLVMLQSGMSIGDVLRKFNVMLDYVKREVMQGAERIRIDIGERKGNNFSYFTFISHDAIQELRKYLAIREKQLEGRPDPETIFITDNGKPYTVGLFETNFNWHLQKAKLKDGAYGVTPHMFRKLFKTESRPPERGIDQDCVEFMMGHLSGIESIGGVYDKTPELYAGVIEREYAKLEPYINIYTGKTAEAEFFELSGEDKESLRQLLDMMKLGKIKIET